MQVQRILTEADSSGNLVGLPQFAPGQTVEVIMLFPDMNPPTFPHRRPPRLLKGKITETGDIFATASSKDWEID